MKPHVLVTNDDGINSIFLFYLVSALIKEFRVSVVAPSKEQSWIGRAITRNGSLTCEKNQKIFPEEVQAWQISGTPTDCVNIALSHLIKDPPEIVVSGINIGFNTAEVLILSSGTIAGAIEGSLWGYPSIAFSQAMDEKNYLTIREKNTLTKAFMKSVKFSAKKACEITLRTLRKPLDENVILNVNFPPKVNSTTKTKKTFPAKVKVGSLFEKLPKNEFRFKYSDGIDINQNKNSDRFALNNGYISISHLNFTKSNKK